MKVAHSKLQEYFATPLPPLDAVADAFTFHTWEIDGIEGDVLDIKVLPNRASDAKTELGIARQLSAILNVPLKPEYEHVELGTTQVRTSLAQINGTLGLDLSSEEVEDVFRRLRLGVEKESDVYIITAPADRTDLTIPVDIAEEVGQIVGYDRVPEVELPPAATPADQERYRGIERIKDVLVDAGFTEVSTQSFATHGYIELANPLDKSKPFLRSSLRDNLDAAYERAKQHAPLVLGPGREIRLFEYGTVFSKEFLDGRETLELATAPAEALAEHMTAIDAAAATDTQIPLQKHELGKYRPFSLYPFITRDIALWAPAGTEASSIETTITENAGALLVRLDQFDRFEKEGRISYGFRMVYQAMDRTLTDEEVSAVMGKISSALAAKGYEIR